MSKISLKRITGVLLLFSCLPLAAQVGELRQNFAIGFSGGANLNKVSITPTISGGSFSLKQGSMMGITGGFTARYISEKYFAMICGVQVEINYAQRGWKEVFDESPDTYTRTMNYVEIPLLAHLAFGRERGARFFINLGPQMNFLLGESEKYSDNWNSETHTGELYGKMAQNKFDYGIVGGGGLELRTKAGNFLLEGRYYFGLADFFNTTKKDPFSRAAHSTVIVKLSYLFDLTR